jgi:uncharacterized membrane protein
MYFASAVALAAGAQHVQVVSQINHLFSMSAFLRFMTQVESFSVYRSCLISFLLLLIPIGIAASLRILPKRVVDNRQRLVGSMSALALLIVMALLIIFPGEIQLDENYINWRQIVLAHSRDNLASFHVLFFGIAWLASMLVAVIIRAITGFRKYNQTGD